MALATSTLKTALYNLFIANLDNSADSDSLNAAKQKAQTMANAMGDCIEAFVKSGQVDFTSGTVIGTCAGPGNPLTAGAASNGVIS